jgi:hypothetical protein
MRLFTEMHSKRRAWTRAIERAKSSHWKEFLDQASSQTVLKTTAYLERQDNYACIPTLQSGDIEYTDNPGKARALLECSFPIIQQVVPEMIVSQEEIPWDPITEQGLADDLKRAKKTKAPGYDGLPSMFWHEF